MKKILVVLAMFLAMGFVFSSMAMAGTVNVDANDQNCDDTNRNTSPISNDDTEVTIWITQAKNHVSTTNLVSLYGAKGEFLASVCPTFTQCGGKYDQYWKGLVSFDSLLNQETVGNIKVVVTVGCEAGKVYGSQTVALTD